MSQNTENRFAVGEELEALRRQAPWEKGESQTVEVDRGDEGKSLSELPLYEVVQEIEAMLTAYSENELEAMHSLSDNRLLQDNIPEGPNGGITWYCEFGGHKRLFDTLAAARHWFLHEIEVEEKK